MKYNETQVKEYFKKLYESQKALDDAQQLCIELESKHNELVKEFSKQIKEALNKYYSKDVIDVYSWDEESFRFQVRQRDQMPFVAIFEGPCTYVDLFNNSVVFEKVPGWCKLIIRKKDIGEKILESI